MQNVLHNFSSVSESSSKMAEKAMNEALNTLTNSQEKVCSFCSQVQLNVFPKTCSSLGQELASV